LRPHSGGRLPSNPVELAAVVEAEYGLPPGSVYSHDRFAGQRHRADDPHYYVAPRADAIDYAKYGGEALGDALQAAFFLLYPGRGSEKTLDGKRWLWSEWVESQVSKFGATELEQVDVPHEVIREYDQFGFDQGYTDVQPGTPGSWLGVYPEPDDEQGWLDRTSIMSWPAGIGLTPAQRNRTIIERDMDWAQEISRRLPGGDHG
jgi:hypothetical protein